MAQQLREKPGGAGFNGGIARAGSIQPPDPSLNQASTLEKTKPCLEKTKPWKSRINSRPLEWAGSDQGLPALMLAFARS